MEKRLGASGYRDRLQEAEERRRVVSKGCCDMQVSPSGIKSCPEGAVLFPIWRLPYK